ncbi:penicillin-binding protein 2 [Echinimonas agarilytica]|uniref:Peptidoglycan D,D-transpeptidase MrdA n=1 Tax=Echinimonas agarilytica TaxID=1215918 RepID=A0AA41W5G0_9GAMM|nr:penicillin-binding protein 2 [Echinimonas agarilytica]MCM2679083.1 penicillin-binding protein 2 [Echinimonas agarilytica]
MIRQRSNQIRDRQAESALFYRRAIVALFVVVLMLAILISNLYRLQVSRHDDFETRSNDNRIRVLPVAPNRGLIFDRNGILLADNRPVYSLELVPEEVSNLKGSVMGLGDLLDISQEQQDKFLEQSRVSRRFKKIILKNDLTEEEVSRFSVNQHLYPGAYIEARLKRHYPFGDALTHAVGYVARINKRDLERLDKTNQLANYRGTHDIGKQGLERYYEDVLHGEVGFQEVEVNNRGRITRTVNFEAPVPGNDLHLSLDIQLQLKASELLAGKRGAIVALDPRDGSVLALVSGPSYDPNPFVKGISGKAYRKLLNSQDRPLINRTTQGQYPPASTVKPIIGLLALNESIVTPATRVWDPGFFQIDGVARKYRDWKKWGHGWVDLYSAIEQSCNIYFFDAATKLGIDKIDEFASQFGFGEYSGIDIREESAAVQPSRAWKRAKHGQPWYLGDTVNIGIGQGYWTATPIQLAHAIGILSRHGENYTPRMVQAIQSQTGTIKLPPDERPPVELKQERYWDEVIEGMRRVNHGVHGTARKAFADTTYMSGGKSGTAQVFSLKQDEEYDAKKLNKSQHDNAMFVSFAPVNNPQIVVAVAIENQGGGSSNAAPMARAMIDFYANSIGFDTPLPTGIPVP